MGLLVGKVVGTGLYGRYAERWAVDLAGAALVPTGLRFTSAGSFGGVCGLGGGVGAPFLGVSREKYEGATVPVGVAYSISACMGLMLRRQSSSNTPDSTRL